MIIREADFQDIDQVTILGKDLLDLHATFDWTYYTLEENFSPLFSDWVRNQLHSPHQVMYVAELENQVIGFISGFIKSLYPWFKVKKVGHVSYLAIAPTFRKQHIGKQLEQKLYVWFKEKNVEYVEVYTDEKNGIGGSAWTSYGYLPFKKYLRKKI